MVSIFFDLEKAYDTTWKYGIMNDLYDIDPFSLKKTTLKEISSQSRDIPL